jgi:hypothetical protein
MLHDLCSSDGSGMYGASKDMSLATSAASFVGSRGIYSGSSVSLDGGDGYAGHGSGSNVSGGLKHCDFFHDGDAHEPMVTSSSRGSMTGGADTLITVRFMAGCVVSSDEASPALLLSQEPPLSPRYVSDVWLASRCTCCRSRRSSRSAASARCRSPAAQRTP